MDENFLKYQREILYGVFSLLILVEVFFCLPRSRYRYLVVSVAGEVAQKKKQKINELLKITGFERQQSQKRIS